MKIRNRSAVFIIGILLTCFAFILIFVSLLGENNKIDHVVDAFFEKIQSQQYFSIDDNGNIVENANVFDVGGDFSENCLLLELALLEKYDITDASKCKIEVDKECFWVPFVRGSDINVGISLKNPEAWQFSSLFKKGMKTEPIENLFTVTRTNGKWLISSIHLKDSPLIASVNRLREGLHVGDYVTQSGTKIIVNPIQIDTENISAIEKLKLSYIFQKLNMMIETSGK